ncbi:unnamed protein product [Blepharisma stoltei]|uniref:Protein kinase domain-containing protein n=1 Tax=Blepharisma stoltei TaxID=1481888 RepID=A0AAU9K9M2_9CILI|nr:unnamed protein product [Blepharisma stoltei]
MWKLDDFATGRLLGSGGFGKVYLATERASGKDIALKITPKSTLDRHSEILLRREIEIQARINHKSIIRLYGYFQDESMIYIVLEYASRGSLFSYIKEHGPISELDTKFIIKKIAKGIRFLHNLGILHRDLKPENILLSTHLKPKITDFGYSAILPAKSNKRYTMCGTVQFVSPEMASGDGYGREADIWALGMIMYEMLNGSPPAIFVNPNQVLEENKFVYPESWSRECKDLCQKMLSRQNRIGIDEILRHPWFIKIS